MRRIAFLLTFILGWSFASSVAFAQRVHALLVADASPAAGWGKFAPHVHWDSIYMFSMLSDNVPPDRLEMQFLTIEDNAQARPAAILEMLDALKPAPEDTLIVYYTGHGAADDRGHYFDMAGGKLYRNDLRQTMAVKGAHLTTLITDCCNVRSDGERIAAGAPGPDERTDYSPVFRSLFIEPSGVVDINACAPGESAFFLPETANEFDQQWGSLFTKAMTNYVRENKDREVTWDDLLTATSFQVNVWFRAGYPKGAPLAKGRTRQMDQNVFAFDYPGRPDDRGQRAGIWVKNRGGRGVVITEVRADYPAARIYDLTANNYAALAAGQVITTVNGKPVGTVDEFLAEMKASPQVMRLLVNMDGGAHECLIRLRY